MPRIIRSKAPHYGEQRVFIATPAYGDVCCGYAMSLFETGRKLEQAGISSELFLLSGNCHVDDSRNECVRSFLETDCTELLFLDADLRWNEDDFTNLLSYDVDVVGATYPLKQNDEAFPVLDIGEEQENGLYKVNGLPTGFLRIKRHVLQRLYNESIKFKGKKDSKDRLPLGLIFERTIENFNRYGGDYAFCKKWRATGGSIYLMPDATFNHFGEHVWTGNYNRFQRRMNGKGTEDYLLAVEEGFENIENIVEFYNDWGNDWSATPEFLVSCVNFARKCKSNILEMGSGMTTLAMAKANPNIKIHSFEHDPFWSKKMRDALKKYDIDNVILHQKPLKEYDNYYWYDVAGLPKEHYDFVVCDGPPRVISSRRGLFDNLSSCINGGLVLMDDADDQNQLDILNDWSSKNNRKVDLLGEERLFAISTKGIE